MRIDYGDLPTWIAAIGSAVAVIAAISAGNKAKNLLIMEQHRDDDARQREIRNQANQIAGWIYPDIEPVAVAGRFFKVSVACVISNPSLQPIYNVSLIWRHGHRGLLTNHVKIVPPQGRKVWRLPDRFLNYLGPEFSPAWNGAEADAQRKSREASEKLGLRFSFTDSQGKRWERNEDGILSQISLTQAASDLATEEEIDNE